MSPFVLAFGPGNKEAPHALGGEIGGLQLIQAFAGVALMIVDH
jgi:hypothetical protein